MSEDKTTEPQTDSKETTKPPKQETKPAKKVKRTFTELQQQAIDLVKSNYASVSMFKLHNLGTPSQVSEIDELLYGEDPVFYFLPATGTVVLAEDYPNYYATEFSGCFEIPTLEDIEIKKGTTVLVPLEVNLEALGIKDSPNHCLKIYPRSSTHKSEIKREFTLANSVGFIDSDYPDTVFAKITNHGETYKVSKGERLVQGEVVVITRSPNIPVKMVKRTGGNGSTGE